MTKRNNPLHKTMRETSSEHQLFTRFLECPDIEKLSDLTGVQESVLIMIAKKNDWEERKFASEAAQVGLQVTEAELIPTEEFLKSDMRTRHRQLCHQLEWIAQKGVSYYGRYMAGLEAAEKAGEEQPKRPPISLDSLTKFVEATVRLSRLTEGEASSITETKTTVDYSKLSVEELKELKRLNDLSKKKIS
jgi:hypothetical protein